MRATLGAPFHCGRRYVDKRSILSYGQRTSASGSNRDRSSREYGSLALADDAGLAISLTYCDIAHIGNQVPLI